MEGEQEKEEKACRRKWLKGGEHSRGSNTPHLHQASYGAYCGSRSQVIVVWPFIFLQDLFFRERKYKIRCKNTSNHTTKILFIYFKTWNIRNTFLLDRKMGGGKYKVILKENLFEAGKGFMVGQRFTFQQDEEPKHSARAAVE